MVCRALARPAAKSLGGRHGGSIFLRPSASTSNADGSQLAYWQLRRATKLMTLGLADGVSVVEVACACRLSRYHFIRAFANTVGVPPYEWLQHRRIMVAKQLLADESLSLAQIALECGFANQSHFTKAFARRVGVPPGRYRRDMRVTSRI